MIETIHIKEKQLQDRIIDYLKSKGKIRAALLHKLENRFCKKNSIFRVRKGELISCLLLMMKEKKIEIIIPERFQVGWTESYLKNLKYLKDGLYLTRQLYNLEDETLERFHNKNYFFDSRTIDFNEKEVAFSSMNRLKEWIKKLPYIKYDVIIYYPKGSQSLNIYEPFEGDYRLRFFNIQVPIQYIQEYPKIQIDLDQQKSDLAIIKNYRTNFMCFYIKLIESIHKAIIDFQVEKNSIKNNKKYFRELINKFAYYCLMYVRSDWVEIHKPNPYRWETFFKFFDLPLKILTLDFKSIKFKGRTFENWGSFKFCIFIEDNEEDIIFKLKKLGFQEFPDVNVKNKIAIGLDLEIYIPCPSIEHFYFLLKYICYYHLFLLFFHSFTYLKKIKTNFHLTEKERTLYKIFLPVINSLFNVDFNKINNKLVFKYYTLNSEELEPIYNKFLVSNVKIIEKRLFKYFLFRSSKFR